MSNPEQVLAEIRALLPEGINAEYDISTGIAHIIVRGKYLGFAITAHRIEDGHAISTVKGSLPKLLELEAEQAALHD